MAEKLVRDALILFSTLDPFGTLVLFVSLAQGLDAAQRARLAGKAVLYAGVVLLGSLALGQLLLSRMGIHLTSLQIAGGILLFLFGLKMVFGEVRRPKGLEEGHDLAVYPLAIPSIASPGAIMAAIVLTDNELYPLRTQALTALVLVGVLVLTYILLRLADPLHRLLGRSGGILLMQVSGMLLSALAVQMTVEGVVALLQARPR